MSLKAIEMQIALPRITDAGLVQNQLAHKVVNDQSILTSEQLKNTENLRHKSENIKEKAAMHIKEDNRGKEQEKHNYQSKTKKNLNTETEDIEHPYKGHRIDLTM